MLALPRSLADYRAGMPAGGYTGLPINAPFANRLSRRRFTLEGRPVVLGRDVAADRHGSPIHGTFQARPFIVDRVEATAARASLVASYHHRDRAVLRAFPFDHSVTITAVLDARALHVTTTVTTRERVAVPVSFGWHPFLQVPGSTRSRWRLRLPAGRHAVLDERLLPTGEEHAEPATTVALARRTFDDHYRLGRDRRFELAGPRGRVVVRLGEGYEYAQIYVPEPDAPVWATTDFACIEPMTAPIDALVTGSYPVATRARPFRASFAIGPGAT
jgi:galactose mutarotase-like enzyme